jgi:soluble lytic murein transglycosylase
MRISMTGEAAAAAYLALGHAYLLDKRYAEAMANCARRGRRAMELADYADFLGARANHEAGNEAAAEAIAARVRGPLSRQHLCGQAPELEANVLLAMGNAAGAQQACWLSGGHGRGGALRLPACAGQVAWRWADAGGGGIFKRVLLSHPLSSDAQIARAKLTAMGAESEPDCGRVAQPGRCLLQRGPL